MSKGTPIPYEELLERKNNLVTTIQGDGLFDETDYDYFARSPGKLTPKPDDTHRKKLLKRAKEHIALANNVVPKSKMKSPSEKKTERMRMKLRSRDGFKCPDDFKGPEIVKTPENTDAEISADDSSDENYDFDKLEDAD